MTAQDRGSLTDEFKGLSARERSRIAREEEANAAADIAFQRLMHLGDSLSRVPELEAALDQYREARRLRPYNVHPKVRIQDLEQRIERERKVAAPPPASADTAHHAPRPVRSAAPEPSPPPAAVSAPSGPPPPVRASPPADRSPTHPAPEHPPVEVHADGMSERSYKEGQAIVLERTLTTGGVSVVYRRVRHSWGAVFHFRDGEPITERAWNEVFPGR